MPSPPASSGDDSPFSLPPGRRLIFRIEDGPEVVSSVPRDRLGERAAAVYPDYRVPSPGNPAAGDAPDPSGDPGDEGTDAPARLYLARADGGCVVGGPGWREETGDDATALTLWEVALTNLLAGRIRDALRLHAGGVRGSAGALLLSGPPEAGKSTLTAALARRGFPVYGDDVVLLDRVSGFLRPFKRLLKLTPPGVDLLDLPRGAGPGAGYWPDHSFLHPGDLGSHWAEPAPVAVVAFPRRVPEPEVTLSPLGGGEAVRRVLEQTLFATTVTPEDFAVLATAVEDARFYEVAAGELESAAEALASLVEG